MNPKDKIHSSWNPIKEILEKDVKLQTLSKQILPNIKYYPSSENIFNVFQTPVQDVKVVILGQDPYPNENQAIGYAFAINGNIKMPPSLKIINEEIINSNASFDFTKIVEPWQTLSHLTEQGVFLLNTALTVEAKKAGSHLGYWEDFTCEVIKFIEKQTKPIWVLWGAKAQAFEKCLNGQSQVLKAPHPAAEAYAGGKAGFYGCNHFNLVNNILVKQGKTPIHW